MTTALIFAFPLLTLFQIKHFLCDYPLQTPYMLGKGKGGREWIAPLAAHAAVHALGTFLICGVFTTAAAAATGAVVSPAAALLALADFAVHFAVDRVKASPKLGGRFQPAQPQFWWALGADQMAHHLTHYAFIATLISLL